MYAKITDQVCWFTTDENEARHRWAGEESGTLCRLDLLRAPVIEAEFDEARNCWQPYQTHYYVLLSAERRIVAMTGTPVDGAQLMLRGRAEYYFETGLPVPSGEMQA